MAEPDETPSQRQARIRRQKREAKISANATERLDKITRLSGRTPESVRREHSPAATPPQAATPTPMGALPPSLAGLGIGDTTDPAQMRMQEEYLRNLLRAPPPGQNNAEGNGPGLEQEDQMMKMLSSMLGGMGGNGDPNAPGAELPSFSSDDFSKATGLPPFVTKMMMGGSQKAPPTVQEVRNSQMWKVIHALFAVVAGIYLLLTIDQSTSTFGDNPPAPATARNPFVVFLTGELFVQGARIATAGQSGKSGPGLMLQMLRECAGDGAIVVFMLGTATWWNGFS